MEQLIANGNSAEDYAIKLEGIVKGLDNTLKQINTGIVTYEEFMSWTRAQFGKMITYENIQDQKELIYSTIVDLVREQIKEEFKTVNTAEDIATAVGKIMGPGFLE